jgi:hypothetical protein
MDWASAQKATSWCPLFPNALGIGTTPCGGFDVVNITGADWAAVYYYDSQSGALVAIAGAGNENPLGGCIAGQLPNVSLADCIADAGTSQPNVCQDRGEAGANDGSNGEVGGG